MKFTVPQVIMTNFRLQPFRREVGADAAGVHQVPEGHHEQQGRPARHLRQQGGPHAHRQVVLTQPAQRHAGLQCLV